MTPAIIPPTEVGSPIQDRFPGAGTGALACSSMTIFTHRWKEVRNFYVEILGAKVLSERPERICDIEIGNLVLALRGCDNGESMSYFHLHLQMADRAAFLAKLRRRGIIVTMNGEDTNLRDPEGRVIRLSEAQGGGV